MPDYCITPDSGLLTIEQALSAIDTTIAIITGHEFLSLKNALGRHLLDPVLAAINLPTSRNSSMDGYAFFSEDINRQQSSPLTVIGSSWAGRPFEGKIYSGQCVRIFTGAVVPDGADSVIMQEQVQQNDNVIIIPSDCEVQQNIREIGEDVKQGTSLIAPSKKLTAIDIGLLASAGVYEVKVYRKLKVAFFSTGDELTAIGQPLQAGRIYDSNRYTLSGLLNDPAYDCTDLGVIVDDQELLKNKILEAAGDFDVILSTGGASVGEADFIKPILDQIGSVNFWRIAMKPGKPLAFGNIGSCYFFGLPGNPISVIATFHQIVTPALKKLSGTLANKPLIFKASCKNNLKKTPGRKEFQRGILAQTATGEWQVESAGKQGSHILSATSLANCYIILSADCTGKSAGDLVNVQPFNSYFQ